MWGTWTSFPNTNERCGTKNWAKTFKLIGTNGDINWTLADLNEGGNKRQVGLCGFLQRSSQTLKLPEQMCLYQKPGVYCNLRQLCVLQDQNQLQPSKIVWYLLDRGNHLCRNQYLNGDKLVETCMRDRIQAPKITKVRRESSAPTSVFEPCTVRAKKEMTNAQHVFLVIFASQNCAHFLQHYLVST